jgi:SAM-dependent methyltransferase
MSEAVDPRWFEGFFGEDWLRIALTLDDERTERQIDFVVEKLDLEPGARILDLACGHGRHSVRLAERGPLGPLDVLCRSCNSRRGASSPSFFS